MRHLTGKSRLLTMASAVALVTASAALTAPARADDAINQKWIDNEFQPSTLTVDEQKAEIAKRIEAALVEVAGAAPEHCWVKFSDSSKADFIIGEPAE